MAKLTKPILACLVGFWEKRLNLFSIHSARSRLLAALWMRNLITVVILLLFSGCAVFKPGTRSSAAGGDTLEEALADLVPMPFDREAGANPALSSVDRADLAAASAAASSLSEADLTHFTETGEPILRMGLVLNVAVRVGDKLEVDPMEVRIMDKGEISLPMIGTVACEGMTLPQLRRALEERYGAFYREPDISLSFVYDDASLSPWGRVLVQGRVVREGWVNIPPTRDMTVSRAIQIAGGYNSSAKKNAIIVTRRLADGDKNVLRVDLERVGRKGEIERDIGLLPGDVVYVPESKY